MVKAIKNGSSETENALFDYLGNSLGFTGEVYEEGVLKTLAWLVEGEGTHYPNIEFLMDIDAHGFYRLLSLTASNTLIKEEQFNSLWKILLRLIQKKEFEDKGPFVVETICTVFERRKHFPEPFVKDIINASVSISKFQITLNFLGTGFSVILQQLCI